MNKKANENMEHLKKLKSGQHGCEKKFQRIIQLFEDTHCTNYDKTFVWKITNVPRKIHEDQSGKQTSIESSVLYSSLNDYKMRVSLSLNKNNDTTLSWLFTIPVRFYPDIKSSSF
ncbi:unnamed protein product [Rotaria sp. Silwood1]|nr:unnamed protein product [Rotaria sp. Silwood1]CAF4932416.1 unnamed protein product [Rotaria sp. Silwood1]